MKMFPFKMICTFLLAALFVTGCKRDNAGADAGLDTGRDAPFSISPQGPVVVGPLQADTLITLVVSSKQPWTATSSDDTWCDVTIHSGVDNTMLQLSIKQNETIAIREGDITFDFGRGTAAQTLTVRQFPTGNILSVADSRTANLDYQAQQCNFTVVSNLNPTYRFVPESASSWFPLTVTQTALNTYQYSFDVPQNDDLSKHEAQVIIESTLAVGDDGEPLRDTIFLSQMYYVEALAMTITNDNSGLSAQWASGSNPAIGYYYMTVTDASSNPLANIDVTGLSSYDLGSLSAFAVPGATYIGKILVQVSGKESATDETIFAQTPLMTTSSHFGGGTGTAADPYQIGCPRHLNNLIKLWSGNKSLLSVSYQQSADITLGAPVATSPTSTENFTPIGDSGNMFTGTYDGNGFALNNLYIVSDLAYVAPFMYVGPTGTVTNLTVQVNRVEGDMSLTVGAIAGVNQGTISNCAVVPLNASSVIYCTNNGGKTNDGGNYNGYVGAICGGVEGTVTGCSNSCPIATFNIAGGIVGGMNTTVTRNVNINNCYNTADIFSGNPPAGVTAPGGITWPTTGTGTSNQTVGVGIGGIGGRVEYPSTTNSCVISNCFNSGNIYSDGNCGGLVGRLNLATLQNCYNTGNVTQTRTGAANNANSGGCVGLQGGNSAKCVIANCYNTGSVNNTSTSASGLAGYIVGNKNNVASFLTDVVSLTTAGNATAIVNPTGTGAASNVSGGVLLNASDMQNLANYPASFTTDIWQSNPASGYLYPQLQGLPHVNRQ